MGLFGRLRQAEEPELTVVEAQPPPVEDAETEALLDRGDQLRGEGDLDGAEAAYEEAEEAGDVRGCLKLAGLLEDDREDFAAAEAAWRRADEAGNLNGAGNLGRLLREQGDPAGAEAAFRRCVDRGSVRAIGDWAGLLSMRSDATLEEIAEAAELICGAHDRFVWHGDTAAMTAMMVFEGIEERCDPVAIEVGLRRADEQGSAAAPWHLAWALRAKGNLPAAVAAFRRAGERGFEEAWVKEAGACLEMGDAQGAEAAAKKGDEAGSPSASGLLGAILDERGRTDAALAAYRRADAGDDGTGPADHRLGVLARVRGR
jgi:tetratricopeptide (TPR) repeat protein